MQSMSARGVVSAGMAALLLAPLPADATLVSGDAVNGQEGVVVNEFTPSGWLWHATDEFVELHNTTDQTVALLDWKLVACLSPGTSQVVARFGPAHVIPPRGFLLIAHIDYANGTGGAPDGRYDTDVPEDGGWFLRDPWSGYTDGVGLGSGLACTEGDPAPQCNWAAGEAATRNELGQDTDDNAADFTCQPRTPAPR